MLQALPHGMSEGWLDETQTLLAELPNQPPFTAPDRLFGLLASGPLVAAVVVCGFVILGLVYNSLLRRVREVRLLLVSLESRYESALRRYEGRLAAVERRLKTEPAKLPLTSIDPPPPALSKRENFAAMVQEGIDPAGLASRLDLRPAEVELLLGMSRLERGQH